MTLRRVKEKAVEAARTLASNPSLRRTLTVTRYCLLAGVIVFLLNRLSGVGWSEVARNLPATPLFYLIFGARYLLLPLAEIPAYEIVWRRPLWRHFSAFLRKRVYNFAIMGYSGEAFFALWARRTLNLPDRKILGGIKDNNVVSASISNVATAIVVLALFFLGGLGEKLAALPGSSVLFAFSFTSALALAAAAIVFRRRIMDLPLGDLARLAAINGARILVIMGLHALLYASALPGPLLSSWLIFIALRLVLSRVPFLPGGEIVFLTAAIHFAAPAGATEAEVAGMLVAEAGLFQASNLAIFIATAHLAFGAPKAVEKTAVPQAAALS